MLQFTGNIQPSSFLTRSAHPGATFEPCVFQHGGHLFFPVGLRDGFAEHAVKAHLGRQIPCATTCWVRVHRAGDGWFHRMGAAAKSWSVSTERNKEYRGIQPVLKSHGRPPSTAPVEWADAGEPDPSDTELWDALYSYAPKVVELAKGYGISILMLQPLNQFEGWAEGTKREQWSRAKAEKWLPLCAKLGVEQIQVSSRLSETFGISASHLIVPGWIQ